MLSAQILLCTSFRKALTFKLKVPHMTLFCLFVYIAQDRLNDAIRFELLKGQSRLFLNLFFHNLC